VRVLHVLDHSIPLHSGYSFRTRAILEEQRALGIETLQVTGSKHTAPYRPEEVVDGLRFFRTPPAPAWARLPVLGQAAVVRGLRRRLEELVAEHRPDLLQAHSPCLNALAALPVARRHRIPLVYEMRASWEDAAVNHGTCREGDLRYRLSRALESWVLRRADAVTTICEGLREEIMSRGIPPERITVIPNAVDVESFPCGRRPDPGLVRELGLEDRRVLGFIGSFYHYEGLHLLLDAMPRILAAAPDVRLLLVGGGFEEARLKAQAEALGLGDAVRFTGRVPHERVQDYYALCTCMVYPRLDLRLTRIVTPLKPLEAMAQGRLVAASDIGGHRELVRPGETGILFPPDDPAALAQGVLELLGQPGRWPELRSAARRFVEQERTWAASVAHYLPVYEALTGRRAPALAGSRE